MGMKRKKRASRRRGWLLGSSATQVICISFVLLIALGTLLLTLFVVVLIIENTSEYLRKKLS